MINIKLLNDKAKKIQRSSNDAAGYDIFSPENHTIEPHSRVLIKTGFCLEIPDGYYGRIAPRSGLALKHGIDVLAGVIDSDYRGEVGVILYNTDKENKFEINSGDRIAQIIFEKHHPFSIHDVSDLKQSERADGGFGSTGK